MFCVCWVTVYVQCPNHVPVYTDGYYMYMESSGHAHQAVARLVSRQVSHGHSGSKCLSFWYHMYGKYVESLSVILLYHNGMELTKWEANGDKGDEWHKAYLNLPKDTLNGPFQVNIIYRSIKEWINKKINEWMNEWINE